MTRPCIPESRTTKLSLFGSDQCSAPAIRSITPSKPTKMSLFGLHCQAGKEENPVSIASASTACTSQVGLGGFAQHSQVSNLVSHVASWDLQPLHSGRAAALERQCSSEIVTNSLLEKTMEEFAESRALWDPTEYEIEQLIQKSISNHGRVDRVKRKQDGKMFAVKSMPKTWVRMCQDSFTRKYPTSLEQPWKDIAIVKLLNDLKFPYACQMHGLFRDAERIYVSTSLASQGDLFSLCNHGPQPGVAREEWLVPVMIQTCSAIRYLHDLNVAHLDLSLENILVDNSSDEFRIRLIDFGMAHVSRFCQPASFGKVMYRAPELMGTTQFDAFKADSFSLGVILYTLVCQDYPWLSTSSSAPCARFACVQALGLTAFVARQRLKEGTDRTVASVLSLPLLSLLSGLLEMNPLKRLSLGEKCLSSDKVCETSVWELSWLSLPILGGAVECV